MTDGPPSSAPLPERPLRLPPVLTAYRLATACLAPAAPFWLGRRARRGKEDPARLGERYGEPTRPRPAGFFVWAHGASIGESLTLLPVVEALVARGIKVLVTSGTRTSAEILSKRLPAGARHQLLPLDVPRFVRRFLDHWRPDLALIVESEVWPNLVVEADRRRVPLVLLNGRMSARSFARWQRLPAAAENLLGRFAICLAQSRDDAERLARLGAPVGGAIGNLKYDVPPPRAAPAAVEALAGLLAGRPVWLAASTHPGEEAEVFRAHLTARERLPDIVTIVAPRHPERGEAVEDTASAMGLTVSRRSREEDPTGADVLIVDTVGELGLFFRVAPLVFMGGSLVRHGGQNPIEPARLGAAILHGPHVGNFAEAYAALDANDGAIPVPDGDALAQAVRDLLAHPARLRDMARASGEAIRPLGGMLARTMALLEPYLPERREAGEALW